MALGQAAASHPLSQPDYDVEFLLFDGRKINLPDASVDGIMYLSAFHHVPNPDVIVSKFARILIPWGMTGLNKPGPQLFHSD